MYNIVKYTLKEVRGMATKELNFKMYSLRTPKFMERKDIEVGKNGIDKTHFEKNVILHLFEGMMNIEKDLREIEVNVSYIDQECSISFIEYRIIDENYCHVVLETERYGEERTIKDRQKNTKNKKLLKHESVPAKVDVFINLKYGLMFVGKDEYSIINKTTLNTFFHKFRFVLFAYIEMWNKENKETNYRIYKRPSIKVDLIPSMHFFEQIDSLTRIKEFSYTYDPTGANDSINFDELDEMREAGFTENYFKETRKFLDVGNKVNISKLKKLYENLSKKVNFDDFYIKGTNSYGKEKIVKPDFAARSINFRIEERLKDDIDAIKKKIDITLSEDNPLLGKVFDLIEVNEVKVEFTKNIVDEINNNIKDDRPKQLENIIGSDENIEEEKDA